MPVGVPNYYFNFLKLMKRYNLLKKSQLNQIYKDWNFTVGLVDFPFVIEGADVYLYWRSDEDEIKFYHSIEEGYSGRKPIPDRYFE